MKVLVSRHEARPEARTFLRERAPRNKNEGELADVPESRVRLKRLYQRAKAEGFDADVLRVLLPDDHPDAVAPPIKEGRRCRALSRFMIQHWDKMCQQGVVEEGEEYEDAMALFTLIKKSGKLRLIQNCKPLNQRTARAPEMGLPTLREYKRHVLRAKFVGVCDAKAWFYQIAMPKRLRRHFGVRVTGGRGSIKNGRLAVIPMGWSWSPALAQKVASFLVRPVQYDEAAELGVPNWGERPLGVVWLDNFAITGESSEEYEIHRAVFQRRLKEFNVVVDNPELEPQTDAVLLGMEVKLREKIVRLAETKELAVQRKMKIREFYELMGNLIWGATVHEVPLCTYPHAMQAMGKAAKRIRPQDPSSWEETLQLDSSAVMELQKWIDNYQENEWRGLPMEHDIEPTCEAWSDASDQVGAAFVHRGERVLWHTIENLDPKQHIFLKEMKMAVEAIMYAHVFGEVPHVYVDNMPVVNALKRRVSTNFVANTIMCNVARTPYRVSWVGTKEQLADPFTRGAAFPRDPTFTSITKMSAP